MKWQIASVVLLLLVFSFGSLAQSIAERALPKDTMMCLSLPNIDITKNRFHKTNFYNFINEPEIQSIIQNFLKQNKIRDRFDSASGRMQAAMGVTLENALASFSGELSFALMDFPIGSEDLEFAAVWEFGSHRQDATQLFQEIIRRIPIAPQSYVAQGKTVRYLKGLENELHYLELKEAYLFATSENLMREMIANLTKEGNALQNHPAYQNFRQRIAGSPDFSCYLHLEKLYRKSLGLLSDQEKALLEAFGILDWKTWGMGLEISDQQILTHQYLDIQPAMRGVNQLFAVSELNQRHAELIPQNTGAFFWQNIHLVQTWRTFCQSYEVYNKEAAMNLQSDLGKLEKAFLEFSIEELLGKFGSDFLLYHLPDDTGSLIPKMIFTVSHTDQSFLLDAANKFANLVGFKVQKKVHEGTDICYLVENYDRNSKPLVALDYRTREQIRFFLGSVAFYLTDDRLYMGRLPQDLMDNLDRSGEAFSLGNVSPFLAKKSLQSLSYLDFKKFIPQIYSTALSLASAVESFPVDATDWPRVQTIVRHLSPEIFGVHFHDEKASIGLKSNFAWDLSLLTGGGVLSLYQVWGDALHKFIFEAEKYLETDEKITSLVSQQKYFAAHEAWQALADSSYFEYFRQIGIHEGKKIKEKYQERQQSLRSKLAQHYQTNALKDWELRGDWDFQNGTLSSKNLSRSNYQVILGNQFLSDYVVEMQVRGIDEYLQFLIHWHQPHGEKTRYEEITFPERREYKNRWVPLKIKVRKDRISYWSGLKHIVRSSSYTAGRWGFMIPSGGEVEIRDLKVTVHQEQQMGPEMPILFIDCLDQIDPLIVGENGQYIIKAHNAGNRSASNVVVHLNLPAHVKFISSSGNYKLVQKNVLKFGPVAVRPKENVHFEVKVQAIKPGSAKAEVTLTMQELQGKIMVAERTHIIQD